MDDWHTRTFRCAFLVACVLVILPKGAFPADPSLLALEPPNDTSEAIITDFEDAATEPAPDETTDDESAATSSSTTRASAKPLSPELIRLRNRLRSVLGMYYPKHLDARQHSCWEVMHGIIAYGVDAKLFRGGPGSQKVNAIGWMCYNQPCHGEALFYLDRGKLVARRGPGLQGHLGQFLAIIAQSHVPADFPMKVSGKSFTVQDLIEHEKSDCRAGEELTFKLIGLSHYLDSDEEWTSQDGQTWTIARLIREELKQPILRVAACGGTHRLMGHSYAIYKRRKQGKPIDGQFARAEKFIADYHKYAFSLQNQDGTFSTRWFEGRESRPDVDRKIKTTGHITEWMVFSLPEEQLQDPRIVKAIDYLVTQLEKYPSRTWEVGPHGHALHALRIYDRRLFKPFDDAPVAKTQTNQTFDAPEPPTFDGPSDSVKAPAVSATATTIDEATAALVPKASKSSPQAGPRFPSFERAPSTNEPAPEVPPIEFESGG